MTRYSHTIKQIALLGMLVPVLAAFASGADSSTQPATEPTTQPAASAVSMGITGDWFGYRTQLAACGITFGGAIDFDYSRNLHGGVSTAESASREITNLNSTITTDQALGWNGGTFFLNLQEHQGQNGIERLAGDAQGFDNQDGPRAVQLSQAWYQQILADDKLRIKIGRVDANTEFAYVSNGTQFLNSSFGYSPAIVGLPTYPDPALSANIFWTFNEHFTLGGGVYDSNSTERSLIFSGRPSAFRPNSGGIFSILEADASWTLFQDNLPGRLGLGGYYHTGRFARFDGTTQTGAIGPYAVFDQTICAAAGISIFAQFAQADADLSLIDEQAGAGFSWTGPLPVASRAADSLGLGLVDAHFSSHAGLVDDHELAIEGFYKIQVTRWFDLQPDLQYILNPGGDGKPDALVATVRVEIDF